MIMRKQFKASWISPFKDSDSSFEDVITGQEPGREKLLLYCVFFLMTDPEFVVNKVQDYQHDPVLSSYFKLPEVLRYVECFVGNDIDAVQRITSKKN